MPNREAITRL